MKVTEEMYTKLFNSVTDTIDKLEEIREELKNIQFEVEEIYISKED